VTPTPDPTPSPVTSAIVSSPSPAVTDAVVDTAAASSQTWLTPALVVSTLALLFTVFTFWWLQARRGRLITFAPQSYAGRLQGDVILSIPLVLYNTGPTPIVVTDFQLRLDVPPGAERQPGMPTSMSWSARQGQLEPANPDKGKGVRTLPAPFSVPGRSTEDSFIEFARKNFDVTSGPFTASIYVRLGRRALWDRVWWPSDGNGWSHLRTLTLHTEIPGPADAYITRTNDPEWTVDSDPDPAQQPAGDQQRM
jgi:hypothetical protein